MSTSRKRVSLGLLFLLIASFATGCTGQSVYPGEPVSSTLNFRRGFPDKSKRPPPSTAVDTFKLPELTPNRMELVAGNYDQGAAHVLEHINLRIDDAVLSAGFNFYGQLGNLEKPDKLPDNPPSISEINENSLQVFKKSVRVAALQTGVQSVGAGSGFSCALIRGGVQCWGWNHYGQLGNQTKESVGYPAPVFGMETGVTQIAVGYAHACAVMNESVYCWGKNSSGQLGARTGSVCESLARRDARSKQNKTMIPCGLDPVQVKDEDEEATLTGVHSVVAGGNHSCALMNDGTVKCWGSGSWVAHTVDASLNNVTSIVAGQTHTCAVSHGSILCWGQNTYGQLGNGNREDSEFPVRVTGIAKSSTIHSLAAGRDHTCALIGNQISCWGRNQAFQLGFSGAQDSPVPVQLKKFKSDPLYVLASEDFTCAAYSDELWCLAMDDDIPNRFYPTQGTSK